MTQNNGKRRWLGAGVTVAVLGGIALVAIWLSLSGSTNPDYQVSTERPGIGEYYVNLWLDPHPPETGDVEISAQLTSIIGSPIELDRLDFAVQSPGDSSPTELDTERTPDGANEGDMFVANTTFDRAGTWRVVVIYSFGGPDVTEAFDIEVGD